MRKGKLRVLGWRANAGGWRVDREARETCFLTKDLLRGKLLLYCFWSFFSFALKKIFSLKSTVRFVYKSSVEKMYLD